MRYIEQEQFYPNFEKKDHHLLHAPVVFYPEDKRREYLPVVGSAEAPVEPEVTIWRGSVRVGPKSGESFAMNPSVEVVYRRTLSPQQKDKLRSLEQAVREAKYSGTSSLDHEDAEARLKGFESSVTEVFSVDQLLEDAKTSPDAMELCRELGVDVEKF